MKDKTIGLIAIGSMITIIESLAILKGIDGIVLAGSVAALVGIFSYFVGVKDKL